jgi:hypothetical protein
LELCGEEDNEVIGVDGRVEGRDMVGYAEELFGFGEPLFQWEVIGVGGWWLEGEGLLGEGIGVRGALRHGRVRLGQG